MSTCLSSGASHRHAGAHRGQSGYEIPCNWITGYCEPLCGCRGPNRGPLQAQEALSTTEPPLKTANHLLINLYISLRVFEILKQY